MRGTLTGAAGALLVGGPTALAFFSGGFFDRPRIVAGVVAWALVILAALLVPRPLPESSFPAALALAGLALLTGWTALSITWAPARPARAEDDLQRLLLYLGFFIAAVALLRGPRARRWLEPALVLGALRRGRLRALGAAPARPGGARPQLRRGGPPGAAAHLLERLRPPGRAGPRAGRARRRRRRTRPGSLRGGRRGRGRGARARRLPDLRARRAGRRGGRAAGADRPGARRAPSAAAARPSSRAPPALAALVATRYPTVKSLVEGQQGDAGDGAADADRHCSCSRWRPRPS